jgi:glyoxylase-like metal-dependent hydrolase (beta-lactamase superfamily II)
MAQGLIEPLTLWVAATNAWLVAPDGPGGECVLIDAPPEPEPIITRLAELDLRLVALLSTHGHIDHVGGISTVVRAQEHEVPVHIHDDDKHMLVDIAGSGGGLAHYLEGLDLRPPELIEGLDDGTVVQGAGMRFEVLHTPGHTPGSVCLLVSIGDSGPILFSGDHLFAGSIGRTDMPGGSFPQLMDSMQRKILPLADEIPVLPGHGGATTIGRERMTNPFLVELQQGGFDAVDRDG